MTRKYHLYTLLLTVCAVAGSAISAYAAEEPEIQAAVTDLTNQIWADFGNAANFECGGLLNSGDTRAHAYYGRLPKLNCTLAAWCSAHDDQGNCTGRMCRLRHVPLPRGVSQQWDAYDCTSGSCVPDTSAVSCSGFYYYGSPASRLRYWECGRATAQCFTYIPRMQYANSYYPMAHNCVIEYNNSPVTGAEPAGVPSLLWPAQPPRVERAGAGVWEATPGSNISVESTADRVIPRDGSEAALDIDRAAFTAENRVTHNRVYGIGQLLDFPVAERTLGRLMQPPEVRLILPKGSHGLEHTGSPLFDRLFTQPADDPPETIVVRTIGSEPDALKTAAEYLRSIPLIETTYLPVTVLVPTASTVQLSAVQDEWRVWLQHAKDLASEQSVSFDSNLEQLVQQNIDTLGSYIALQETVRAYKQEFPAYLDALLTAVEDVNVFFRTQWIEVNAARLDQWYAAYNSYYPALQAEIANMHTAALAYTDTCLTSACRLDALPVSAGTKPWHAFSSATEFQMPDDYRAWSPEAFPLWRNYHGEVDQLHPPRLYGTPLPDITLDLSEIFLQKPIEIPVLKLETVLLDLAYPPVLDDQALSAHFARLRDSITPLPHLAAPMPPLEFPQIVLPDPATSLFVVPEPPIALPVWVNLVQYRTQRLAHLTSLCDGSPQPTAFLIHEFQLYDPHNRDPAAVRSAAFVPGVRRDRHFPPPSFSWPPYSTSGPSREYLGELLEAPENCPGCSTVRPQRYIRQHLQLDTAWESLQDTLLRSLDVWNAQVKFASIVPRAELIREDIDYRPHSGLRNEFFPAPLTD